MKPGRPLTIGIDIDGTLTDPGSIMPLMKEASGKNLPLADCCGYDLAKEHTLHNLGSAQLAKTKRRIHQKQPDTSFCDRQAEASFFLKV